MNPGKFASVFDWQASTFRVYELPMATTVMADTINCTPGVPPTAIGVDVNQALCPLPPTVRYVGNSADAVGWVMRNPQGLMGASYSRRPGLGEVAVTPGLGLIGRGVGNPDGISLTQAIMITVLVNVIASIVTPFVVKKIREL